MLSQLLNLQLNQSPRKLRLSKTKILLGIDEVGRGPWAGPLVIGAAILGQARPEWDTLTDSKKLSAKQREKLNQIILQYAAATGLGWVSAAELDKYGLSNALKLATRRAVKQVLSQNVPFDEVIIDGTINFLADTPLAERVTTLKKADFLVKEVSAASIIAKVARDDYMIRIGQQYPHYGFEKHVGYGTAAHKQALLDNGICPEHRKSFRPVREIWTREVERKNIPNEQISLPKKTPNHYDDYSAEPANHPTTPVSSQLGRLGETAIANYLEAQGHEIIARNFRTKFYEIDIISTLESKIYFTEVKYRKDNSHGTPLDQITPAKLHRMQQAAASFISHHPIYAKYQPLLAAGLVSGGNFTVDDWFVISS